MQETRNNSRNITATYILLLYFDTYAYLSLPNKRSCYVFSTRNKCCEILASYGITNQCVIQSYLKSPDCGASMS